MDDSLFTKDALKKLDECILSGIRSVSFGDKSISFATTEELLKLRAQIAKRISGTEPKRQFFPSVTKGLG